MSATNPFTATLEALLQLRWAFIERILRWRFFSLSDLETASLPGAKALASLTVGDVIVGTPVFLLAVYGVKTAFVDQSPKLTGMAAWYAIVATVLLANKSTSLFAILFGMSWERLVPIHYMAALVAVLNALLHGYACFIHHSGSVAVQIAEFHNISTDGGNTTQGWSSAVSEIKYNTTNAFMEGESFMKEAEGIHHFHGNEPNIALFLVDGAVYTSGTAMTVFLLLLVVLSASRWCRKHNFDLWLVSHILLAVGVAGASLVHAMNYTKLIFIWWAVDAFVRIVIHPTWTSPSTAGITKLDDELVEIRFERPPFFNFKAGQFVCIAVKDLGLLQYHPASISSAPYEEDEVTVHFRVRGGWTQRLRDLADSSPTESSITTSVSVQGPFGSPMMNLEDHRRYPHVILICGGIGVTPMMSVARQLMYCHHRLGQKRYKIHLVWAVPNAEITNVLPVLIETDDLSMPTPDDKDEESESSGTESTTEFSTSVFSTSVRGSRGPLSNHRHVFRGDIYITRGEDVPDWSDDRFLLHFNQRPDPDEILRQTSEDIFEMQRHAFVSCLSHVAVLACGPPALVKATKLACQQRTCDTEGASFHFHEEIFDY